jgi:hypothetical protein
MIFVFKTSVSSISEILNIKPQLDKHLKNAKWNFDLEDCDNILRIDSVTNVARPIIKLLKDNGYDCEELTD